MSETRKRTWAEVRFRKAKGEVFVRRAASVEQTGADMGHAFGASTSVGITSGDTTKRQNLFSSQSSAQVEALVIPKPRALKGKKRNTRSPLTVRFTEAQIAILRAKAEQANRTVSEYVRMASLGDSYIPPPDKDLAQELRRVFVELSRQGNNLNQIAHQLNAGNLAAPQGESMVGILARPFLQTLGKVRTALTRGARHEYG